MPRKRLTSRVTPVTTEKLPVGPQTPLPPHPPTPSVVRRTHLKVKAAHPGWIPVDGPAWRLVDEKGAFLRDPDGHSVRFTTDDEALAYLKRKGIPLLPPRY